MNGEERVLIRIKDLEIQIPVDSYRFDISSFALEETAYRLLYDKYSKIFENIMP